MNGLDTIQFFIDLLWSEFSEKVLLEEFPRLTNVINHVRLANEISILGRYAEMYVQQLTTSLGIMATETRATTSHSLVTIKVKSRPYLKHIN